jgi:class 3 adenylate cyclase
MTNPIDIERLLHAIHGTWPTQWIEHHYGNLAKPYTDIESAVLFTDIQGFTKQTASAGINSECLAIFLNKLDTYFNALSQLIEDPGQGWAAKYIGDSVMAVFPGLSHTQTLFPSKPKKLDLEYCHRALLVAVKRLQAELEDSDPLSFITRFGIHASSALPEHGSAQDICFGPLGTRHPEYTVMGQCVNVASRLQEVNKDFKLSKEQKEDEDFTCRILFSGAVFGKTFAQNKYGHLLRPQTYIEHDDFHVELKKYLIEPEFAVCLERLVIYNEEKKTFWIPLFLGTRKVRGDEEKDHDIFTLLPVPSSNEKDKFIKDVYRPLSLSACWLASPFREIQVKVFQLNSDLYDLAAGRRRTGNDFGDKLVRAVASTHLRSVYQLYHGGLEKIAGRNSDGG